nr:hypothetical protein [Prevotella intermedia]
MGWLSAVKNGVVALQPMHTCVGKSKLKGSEITFSISLYTALGNSEFIRQHANDDVKTLALLGKPLSEGGFALRTRPK